MDYKIGQYHKFDYQNTPVLKENQYKKNQLVKIYNDGTLVAQYEVVKSNQFKVLGRITNTYNHRRKKQ